MRKQIQSLNNENKILLQKQATFSDQVSDGIQSSDQKTTEDFDDKQIDMSEPMYGYQEVENERINKIKKGAFAIARESLEKNRCPKCTLPFPCKHYANADSIPINKLPTQSYKVIIL